jgi:dihydropteroate synthase
MADYYRPLVQSGPCRPADALPLAGGALWFTHAQHLSRAGQGPIVPAHALPAQWRHRLSAPRAPMAGLSFSRPQVMGILNATPDSFSDGGQFFDPADALAHAARMVADGVDIIDVGGESTRPGAETVPPEAEAARVRPVVAGIRAAHGALPISIDTRKASVAQAALAAGATLVNDVSGFTYDPALAPLCAAQNTPICVMHAQGDPQTMQQNPQYENVVLDVYDFLENQLQTLQQAGIGRHQIMVDPGIGFGKTLDHNLALLAGLSLFHGLGCPILLGVSRKKFIATLGHAPEPAQRMPGSIAVALAGVAQGAQVLRVHDVRETVSALALWQAVHWGATAPTR